MDITPVKTITVHDKNCLGCAKHKKDIMISVDQGDGIIEKYEFFDIFLTDKQAKYVMEELAEALKKNEKE